MQVWMDMLFNYLHRRVGTGSGYGAGRSLSCVGVSRCSVGVWAQGP